VPVKFVFIPIMIQCRCPKCSALFQIKAGQFGQAITCNTCSHSWVLDTDCIARYSLPKVVTIYIEDAGGSRIPNKPFCVEYNHPVLFAETDQHGTALVTEEMIRCGLSDFISRDGIMDHICDDPSCQRYLHISVDSKRESVDLSDQREEIEIKIVVT